MRKVVKSIIIIAVSALMLLVGILIFFYQFSSQTNAIDNQSSQKQDEMLDITLEWGRLAPLPDSKDQFQISTEGSAFTRSFQSSFFIYESDLSNWVEASDGLQDAEVKIINDYTKKYVIKPGGGAAYAEVVINFSKGFVETYVYWS